MPNYSKTGPFTNGGAPGISATFLNNVENVFNQPSGGTELGKYFLDMGSYASGAHNTQYMPSLSRTVTPVSVSVDTADLSPTNCNSPTATNLTANGFHVGVITTAINVSAGCAGNFTIQF